MKSLAAIFSVTLCLSLVPNRALAGYSHADDPMVGADRETSSSRAQDALRAGRQQLKTAQETMTDLSRTRFTDIGTVMNALRSARTAKATTLNVLGKVRDSMMEIGADLEADDANAAQQPPPQRGRGLFAERRYQNALADWRAYNGSIQTLVKRIESEDLAFQKAQKIYEKRVADIGDDTSPKSVASVQQAWQTMFSAQTTMLSSRLQLARMANENGGPSERRNLFLQLGNTSLGLRQSIEGNGTGGLNAWILSLEARQRGFLGAGGEKFSP